MKECSELCTACSSAFGDVLCIKCIEHVYLLDGARATLLQQQPVWQMYASDMDESAGTSACPPWRGGCLYGNPTHQALPSQPARSYVGP